jgi:hypothetical protein
MPKMNGLELARAIRATDANVLNNTSMIAFEIRRSKIVDTLDFKRPFWMIIEYVSKVTFRTHETIFRYTSPSRAPALKRNIFRRASPEIRLKTSFVS